MTNKDKNVYTGTRRTYGTAWFTAHPAITAEEREKMREYGKAHGVHFQPGHPVSKGQNAS
jgi:hypothetical protein